MNRTNIIVIGTDRDEVQETINLHDEYAWANVPIWALITILRAIPKIETTERIQIFVNELLSIKKSKTDNEVYKSALEEELKIVNLAIEANKLVKQYDEESKQYDEESILP